jgi:hypothetical protein
MPNFVYVGPGGPRTYPESRDAYGVPLGLVKPGDVLELDQAPDQFWAPYEGEASGTGESMQAVEHPADGTWSPPVSNEPEPAAGSPEPAPQDVPPGE